MFRKTIFGYLTKTAPQAMKHILLVEDDSDDQLFFQAALDEVSDDIVLTVRSNGDLAMDFLSDSYLLPDICIFDINMPGMSGVDLLRAIRQRDDFNSLHIVMFTTSGDVETANTCFELGANAFYLKPSSHELLKAIIHKIIS